MPYQVPLITDEVYHIYNRGIRKDRIFRSPQDHKRWLDLLYWCKTYNYPYSTYLQRIAKANNQDYAQKDILNKLNTIYKLENSPVEILAHVELDNHYHLLIRQTQGDGISKFMSRLQTSFAKYFNTLYSFNGPVFEGMYKAIQVLTDEYVLQLIRYIHLNPLAAKLVNKSTLLTYPWSSLPAYMGKENNEYLSTDFFLGMFNNREHLWKFIIDSIDQNSINSLQGITHDDDFNWYSRFF